MMNTMPFTLRQLQIFASLCETFSFRETAEILGISQASVSSQLKALEDQLGLNLLKRSSGRRPELTGDGDAFLQDFQHFKTAADVLASHRKGMADDSHLTCNIFIGRGLLDDFIRPRMDHFLIENQTTTLSFDAQWPDEYQTSYVENGRFDFGLFHQHGSWPDVDTMQVLRRMKSGVYGHPKFLNQDGSLPDSAALSAMPFILQEAGSIQERKVLRALREQGIRPNRVVCRTPYHDVMASMMERGLGVGCLVENQLHHRAEHSTVLLREMSSWKLLWYARRDDQDPRLDKVEEFLKSCVLDHPDYPGTQKNHGAAGIM